MEMAERFLEATKGCYEPTTKRVLITSLLNQAILTPRSIGEVISCKLCVCSLISNSRWETLKTPDPLCGARVDRTGCESVRLGQSFPQRLPFSYPFVWSMECIKVLDVVIFSCYCCTDLGCFLGGKSSALLYMHK